MWDFNEVKAVSYRGGYVYHVVFDNGLAGDVDFSKHLARGPVFAALADTERFRSATIANGTISWPNGADIAPETLYETLEAANQSSR